MHRPTAAFDSSSSRRTSASSIPSPVTRTLPLPSVSPRIVALALTPRPPTPPLAVGLSPTGCRQGHTAGRKTDRTKRTRSQLFFFRVLCRLAASTPLLRFRPRVPPSPRPVPPAALPLASTLGARVYVVSCRLLRRQACSSPRRPAPRIENSFQKKERKNAPAPRATHPNNVHTLTHALSASSPRFRFPRTYRRLLILPFPCSERRQVVRDTSTHTHTHTAVSSLPVSPRSLSLSSTPPTESARRVCECV